MYVLLIVVVLLPIVLSVLLRYTDSDYPFGIFKLFLLKLEFNFFFKSNCPKSQLLSWFESLPGYLPKIAFKYFENQLFTVIIVLLIPEMYVKKITGLRAFLNIKQS